MFSAILLTIFSNSDIYNSLNGKPQEWILVFVLSLIFAEQVLESLCYLFIATRRVIYTKKFWTIEEEVYKLKRGKIKLKKTFVEDIYHKYTFTKHYFFSCWIIFVNSLFVTFGGLASLILVAVDQKIDLTGGVAYMPAITTTITVLNIIYNKFLSKKTTALYTYTLNKIKDQQLTEE